MAVTARWYTHGVVNLGLKRINLNLDTLKVILLDSGYTPDHNTDEKYSDISAHEVTGTGYTAGGHTLGSQGWAIDAPNSRGKLTGADVVWTSSTITARYAALYYDSGTPSTSYLISYLDFGANVSSVAGDFEIAWDGTNGIVTGTV